jgi:hypothetical protein
MNCFVVRSWPHLHRCIICGDVQNVLSGFGTRESTPVQVVGGIRALKIDHTTVAFEPSNFQGAVLQPCALCCCVCAGSGRQHALLADSRAALRRWIRSLPGHAGDKQVQA